MLALDRPIHAHTTPFQLFEAQGLLGADQLDQLFGTAPTRAAERIAVDDPEHEKQYRMNLVRVVEGDEAQEGAAALPAPWADLVGDLLGQPFTRWLEEESGIKLTGLLRSIGIYAHRNGDFLAVHRDKPTKALTAILYLNPEWPQEAGGRFQLYGSGDAATPPVREIAPQGGQLLAFPPTDRSWHAVSTIAHPADVERLTIQVEYWNSTELMGSAYRPSPR